MSHDEYDEPAPEGQVWVCGACGKTSATRSGYDKNNKRVAKGMWDESCFMNAVLCRPATPEELEKDKRAKWHTVKQP